MGFIADFRLLLLSTLFHAIFPLYVFLCRIFVSKLEVLKGFRVVYKLLSLSDASIFVLKPFKVVILILLTT